MTTIKKNENQTQGSTVVTISSSDTPQNKNKTPKIPAEIRDVVFTMVLSITFSIVVSIFLMKPISDLANKGINTADEIIPWFKINSVNVEFIPVYIIEDIIALDTVNIAINFESTYFIVSAIVAGILPPLVFFWPEMPTSYTCCCCCGPLGLLTFYNIYTWVCILLSPGLIYVAAANWGHWRDVFYKLNIEIPQMDDALTLLIMCIILLVATSIQGVFISKIATKMTKAVEKINQ